MVKRQIAVLCAVAALLLSMAGAASADLYDYDNSWAVQLRAYAENGLSTGTLTLGTKPGASDNYVIIGAEDAEFPPSPPPPAVYGEIISTIVPGQRTCKDFRAPLLPGELKVWDLSLYITDSSSGTITLTGWMPFGLYQLDSMLPSMGLYQGTTLLWEFPRNCYGSQEYPQWSHTFAYSGTPISLQVRPIIPEPAGICAMLGGLVGLMAYGIRRRR